MEGAELAKQHRGETKSKKEDKEAEDEWYYKYTSHEEYDPLVCVSPAQNVRGSHSLKIEKRKRKET